MAHTTESRAPVKPRPAGGRPRPKLDVDCFPAPKGSAAQFMIRLYLGRKGFTYWLRKLASDYGIAYEFQQGHGQATGPMRAETYDVCVEFNGHTCSCVGHGRHGHCKHVDALRLLIERGALEAPVPDPDELGEPCGQWFPDGGEDARLYDYKPAGHDHGIPF